MFAMTFFIVLFIVLMQFLWKYMDDLVGKGLGFGVLAELFFYAALSMIPMALPLAILLASLMSFGNLGEKSELTAIKASGIRCVIAASFARIFYRNSINIGLAIVECPEAAEAIEEGHTVEADLDNGILLDQTTGKSFHTAPFPPFIQTIITNGGLIESIKKGAVK